MVAGEIVNTETVRKYFHLISADINSKAQCTTKLTTNNHLYAN